MPPKKKNSVKFSDEANMLPHSEAKVALYGKYLEKYLAILGVVNFITKINVFDIFCGTGIYRNGKLGSPIIAYDIIKKNNKFFLNQNKSPKPICLIINDGNPNSILKVSEYIDSLNAEYKCCDIEYNNLDAKDMFAKVLQKLRFQTATERNLIFIDPTGYKEIHKQNIAELLKLNSEVVMFLPVSFMYRFKEVVQKVNGNNSYLHLRRFIEEFFDDSHPIRLEKSMSIFEFIDYLKDAFRFDNKYYTSSFFLQRDKANYYALFFITSNALGKERIVDAQWDIDKERGQGFVYEDTYGQMQLFIDTSPSISKSRLNELNDKLEEYIKNNIGCNNCDLYLLTIESAFKVKHTNQVLSEWQEKNKISVWDINNNKPARKKSFYINYDTYKDNLIKVTFKLH